MTAKVWRDQYLSWAVCLLALTAATPVFSAEVPPQSAASGLSVEDFFRRPTIGDVVLSPSGKYAAMGSAQGLESRIDFIDVATTKAVATFRLGRGDFVYRMVWINDKTLVWESGESGGAFGSGAGNGYVGIIRVNREEADSIISGFHLLGRVKARSNTVVGVNGKEIYQYDVDSRRLKKITTTPFQADRFLADPAGTIRVIGGLDGGEYVVSVYEPRKDKWRVLQRLPRVGRQFFPLAMGDDGHSMYVSSNLDSPLLALQRVDLDGGSTETLYQSEQTDFRSVLFDRDHPVGVFGYTPYPAYHFFDKDSETTRRYEAMRSTFPNATVVLGSTSEDGRFGVVGVETDRSPLTYYLYDNQQQTVVKLLSSRPWIDPAQMAQREAFVMRARDGLELHGYLTLPRGVPDQHLPMVVLPHGGPLGIHEIWTFDQEAQFLAYHGYAVLQLNFRGSGGYGREFEQLGFRHWGTTMQDDLTDATNWAIQEGLADRKRICIYGASYGAYAALMGAVREPTLYRCAIGYAGVYDLELDRKLSDTASTEAGLNYLDAALGTDPTDLAERSPATHAAQIKIPLLLAHGEADRRTPPENYGALAANLAHAGISFESILKKGEGHGFQNEANVFELYTRMLDFLDRNTRVEPVDTVRNASR
jgi:dipeptidyl aminopeptidase/acylaminoacyl peptidase